MRGKYEFLHLATHLHKSLAVPQGCVPHSHGVYFVLVCGLKKMEVGRSCAVSFPYLPRPHFRLNCLLLRSRL